MVERRRSRRLLIFAGIATAISVALLSAEVLGNDDNPCRTPSAAPRSEIALLPAGLSF
jgi:hypothetical protein